MVRMQATAHEAQVGDLSLLRQALATGEPLSTGSTEILLSASERQALLDLCSALESGRQVQVRALEEFVSTQEAAELLRVSRPTIVRMIKKGLLDFEQPGVHRRVARASIENFMERRRDRVAQGLNALAAEDPEAPAHFVKTR